MNYLDRHPADLAGEAIDCTMSGDSLGEMQAKVRRALCCAVRSL